MNYKNEELNIFIENAGYFEIKEFCTCVQLIVDGKVKFNIFRNSNLEAHDSSSVMAYGSSSLESFGSFRVEARNQTIVVDHSSSSVIAFDSSIVTAYDSPKIAAYGNSRIHACGNSEVEAYGNSIVMVYYKSKVDAYNKSRVYAYDSSRVVACNSSIIEAYDNSSVEARDNSRVEAYDSSRVIASGFSTIYARNKKNITINNHYGAIIPQVFKVNKKMIVYKRLLGGLIAELELKKGQVFQSANHSSCRTDSAKVLRIIGINGEELQEGFSQHDDKFVYRVGEVVTSEYDPEIREHSAGIHFFLDRKSAEKY